MSGMNQINYLEQCVSGICILGELCAWFEGLPEFGLNTTRTNKQYVCNSFMDCPCSLWNQYRKVASSNMSLLEVHTCRLFQIAYEGDYTVVYVSAYPHECH